MDAVRQIKEWKVINKRGRAVITKRRILSFGIIACGRAPKIWKYFIDRIICSRMHINTMNKSSKKKQQRSMGTYVVIDFNSTGKMSMEVNNSKSHPSSNKELYFFHCCIGINSSFVVLVIHVPS